MNFICVKISCNNLEYAKFYVLKCAVIFDSPVNENYCGCMNYRDTRTYMKHLSVYYDGILTHYIERELILSSSYRNKFISTVRNVTQNCVNSVCIFLIPPKKEILDYSWNYITTNYIREKLELDHALSWLSTLGGAFSALGDYFINCALIAGKISFHQLKLAIRLGDPSIAARCRLYLSLSLIQQGYLKHAKRILYAEYHNAKTAVVKDIRLIRMCLGIWSKLQYEYSRRRNS